MILTQEKVIRSADLLINQGPPAPAGAQQLTMEEMEKKFILESLDMHEGNVSQTARSLGMTRTALYRRMKKHKL